ILGFRSLFQIPDFLIMIVIIIVIYTYSRLVAPKIEETMIPELLILSISFLIFRLHELILRSSFTEILTKITSEIIVNILFTWEIAFIIVAIGIIVFMYKNQGIRRDNGQKQLYLIGIPIILLIFLLIANITQYSFTVIDSMTLLFYRSQDIVRIDIIRDCSGIYGMMIFSCSFLLFGADTKRKIEWDNKKMFLFFSCGLIGVYLFNLLRIITVINVSLFTDQTLKSIIHSYLGSMLILLFVVSYWVLIWRSAFIQKESVHLENVA
ncbi:MAG: hypothetical protein ACTSRJ_04290, partial [Candidatus Hodarchaeales archaeon]